MSKKCAISFEFGSGAEPIKVNEEQGGKWIYAGLCVYQNANSVQTEISECVSHPI